MKTPTDFARDILTNNQQNSIMASDNFVPFLIQKYISGCSPQHCLLINSILNDKLGHWTDNQQIYNFLKCIIPKKKNVGFQYFGKKKESIKLGVDVEKICENMEMPQKHFIELLELFPSLKDNYKEDEGKMLISTKR